MATQLRFDVTALDQASKAFARMGAAVERFEKKLDQIDGKTLDVDVDLNTRKAEAELGKFATDTRRKLDAALKALPAIHLDADSSEAQREIERIRNEMLALRDQRIGVDIDSDKAVAEITRMRAELERLSRDSANVQVKADTAEAIAQLAAVEAAVSAINGQDAKVSVDVDSAPIGAATEALSGMVGMVDAVAAAWPPVSAGILAIPGALQLIAVPLAAVVLGVQGINDAANALTPTLQRVQIAVSNAFQAGLQPAIASVAALMPSLQVGLVGTATALSSVATRVASVVSSADGLRTMQAIFRGVNETVTQLGPAFATLLSNVLKLSTSGLAGLQPLGSMLERVGQQWSAVIDRLNSSGVATAAVSALVSVFGGLLSILPGLVESGARLMAVLGPPLAAALQAVGAAVGFLAGPLGGVTTTILSMAAAFKLANVAVALISGVARSAASGWASMTAAMTGSNAAAAATTATQGAAAASTTAAAAAAATNATALGAQAAAAAESAAALAAEAEAATALAAAARADAVALQAAATSNAELAAAATAGATAMTRQVAAAEASAAAMVAQSRAATAAAAATLATAEAQAATGAAAAAGAAGASKFSSAMSRVGAVLPGLGAALIGIAVVAQQTGTDWDSLTQKVSAGSLSMAQASNQAFKEATSGFQGFMNFIEGDSVTHDQIVTEMAQKWEEYRATLSPMGQLQADVGKAQADLNDKVVQFGPASTQAAAAAQTLSTAQAALAKAQRDAATAASNVGIAFQSAKGSIDGIVDAADAATLSNKMLADAFTNLADPMQLASQKAQAFNSVFSAASDAPTQLAKATQAVNDAMRDLDEAADGATTKLIQANGTINTTTEAGSKLQTAFLGAAETIQNTYGASISAAVASGKDLGVATAEATVQFENQKTALYNLLVSQGASKTAAQALVDTYLKTPPAITTTIQQPGMVKALADAMGLSSQIIGIPDSKSIVVNSLTDEARKQLEDLGLKVITLPNGKILVTADTSAAQSGIITTVQLANGQTGVIKVDANSSMADGKITSTVQFADGSTGTVTIDGNNIPAKGEVTASVTYANGQTGTIKITARDAGAMATARLIADGISRVQAVIGIVTKPIGPAGGGVMGYSGGGIAGPVHAAGGYVVPGYAPGRDTIPAVLSKGEAVLVPELVRMLGARRILAANAEASGGRPAANVGNLAALMDGSIGQTGPRGSSAVSSAMNTVRGAAQAVTNIFLSPTFQSYMPTGSAEQRAVVAYLHEQLRKFGREGK